MEEIKTQIKKFDGLNCDPNDVLDASKALLNSFISSFRAMMGKNFVYLGVKARSLLRNIQDIKKMMWLLVNQDCVVFFNYLNDLRSNDLSESFSIFKYCDEETGALIDKLSKLSKDRIMYLKLRERS